MKRKAEKKISSNSFIQKILPKAKTEIILSIIFLILLVSVILLTVKAVTLKNNQSKDKDILTIPLIENNVNERFSIDLSSMQANEIKEYKFNIRNYQKDTLPKIDIKYSLEIINNNDNVLLKLYKNDNAENLLTTESKDNLIKDNILSKDKEIQDSYYLIIRAKDVAAKLENITVKITSINWQLIINKL